MEQRDRLARILLEEQLRRVFNTLRRDFDYTEGEFLSLLARVTSDRMTEQAPTLEELASAALEQVTLVSTDADEPEPTGHGRTRRGGVKRWTKPT